MNLVTDGFPALALAVDPKSPDLMTQPPRRTEDRLLDNGRLLAIGIQGGILAAIALGAFAYCLYSLHQEVEQARTVAFTVMVIAQLVHAFNCRSERLSLFRIGILTNRPLLAAFFLSLGIQVAILTVPAAAPLFKIAPVPIEDWLLMAGLGFFPLVLMELRKILQK